MNWNNYGIFWHLDHVIPCKQFNLNQINQQKVCFNWRNVSPLEQTINQSKSHRIDLIQVNTHNNRLREFSKIKNIEVFVLDPSVLQNTNTASITAAEVKTYTVQQMESCPSDVVDTDNYMVNNIEDDDDDFDSDIDEFLLIDESDQLESEIGDPQQVLPVTFNNIKAVILQLDSIKL